MTKAVYQSMFIFLSVLLLAVFFVMRPTSDSDVSAFQSDIKSRFVKASAELVQGESFVEPFALVWETTNDFYSQSATATIALLEPDAVFSELTMMFNQGYQTDVLLAGTPLVSYGKEESVYNIVPQGVVEDNFAIIDPYFDEDAVYRELLGGVVAGTSIDTEPFQVPVVPLVWITVEDSLTGYPYCVGVFNGEINSYEGPCAVEEYTSVYEN